MPAKTLAATAGTSAADIDAKLPKGFFVMRGMIRDAFGLNDEEMTVFCVMDTKKLTAGDKAGLVRKGRFVAEYPVPGGRARFVRSQVLAVARKWEGGA